MRGVNSFLYRGYILHRTRGHWTELAVFSAAAAALWWIVRLAIGVFLALFSTLLLAYLLTH